MCNLGAAVTNLGRCTQTVSTQLLLLQFSRSTTGLCRSPPQVCDLGAAVTKLGRDKVALEAQMEAEEELIVNRRVIQLNMFISWSCNWSLYCVSRVDVVPSSWCR